MEGGHNNLHLLSYVQYTRSILQSLVLSLVLSQLDYVNATLVGVSSYLLSRLQSAMNTAVRLTHRFIVEVPSHPSAAPSPTPVGSTPLAEGYGVDCFQVCSPCVQMSSRVCTVIPHRQTLSGGGR